MSTRGYRFSYVGASRVRVGNSYSPTKETLLVVKSTLESSRTTFVSLGSCPTEDRRTEKRGEEEDTGEIPPQSSRRGRGLDLAHVVAPWGLKIGGLVEMFDPKLKHRVSGPRKVTNESRLVSQSQVSCNQRRVGRRKFKTERNITTLR